MALLKKEEALIRRDEKGELIPLEVSLKIPGKPTIKVTPLTKGEIQRILAVPDEEKQKVEDEIMKDHCIEPSYTQEEFEDLKPHIYGAIKIAIMSLSLGKTQEEVAESTTSQIVDEMQKKTKN